MSWSYKQHIDYHCNVFLSQHIKIILVLNCDLKYSHVGDHYESFLLRQFIPNYVSPSMSFE